MKEQIENLLKQMTLEEKGSMLAGATPWTTVPIERLGIPAIKVTDGPIGARGAMPSGGLVNFSLSRFNQSWNASGCCGLA